MPSHMYMKKLDRVLRERSLCLSSGVPSAVGHLIFLVCKVVPSTATTDIEVRRCHDQDRADEDLAQH